MQGPEGLQAAQPGAATAEVCYQARRSRSPSQYHRSYLQARSGSGHTRQPPSSSAPKSRQECSFEAQPCTLPLLWPHCPGRLLSTASGSLQSPEQKGCCWHRTGETAQSIGPPPISIVVQASSSVARGDLHIPLPCILWWSCTTCMQSSDSAAAGRPRASAQGLQPKPRLSGHVHWRALPQPPCSCLPCCR